MRLTASTTVPQDRPAVWGFLADPTNSPSWDRSIAEVIPAQPGQPAVGWEAQTVSPDGKRQRFRITTFDPCRALAFRLLGDRMFERAELRFDLESTGAAGRRGTRIVHTIDLRTHHACTGLVLALASRSALARDLRRLRTALAGLDASGPVR